MSGTTLEGPRETFRRLAALAGDEAAPEAERASARRVMDRYLAKYGAEVSIPEKEPEISRDLRFGDETERTLARHCATFAGCVALDYGHYRHENTAEEKFVRGRARVLCVTGAESAVLTTLDLFTFHREKLSDLLELMMYGYLAGAMPTPPRPSRPSDDKERPPISKERLALIHAAIAAGRSSKHLKRLDGPTPPTEKPR